MAERGIPDIHQQIAAAFDWWREAGVDSDFADEPKNWIAPAEPAVDAQAPFPPPRQFVAPAPAVPAAPALDLSALPADLPAFIDWWLADPLLDAGRTAGRVPPRGSVGADLMVLVPHPEEEDRANLLSGPHGRLLNAILQAMGTPPDAAYVASALPRHTPHADWPAAAAAGMGAVLARHVKLVAPRRLIVFGNSILPLLGNDLPNSPADLQQFNHEGASVALLVARDLALLERPKWKAGFWQRWLEWTSTSAVGE